MSFEFDTFENPQTYDDFLNGIVPQYGTTGLMNSTGYQFASDIASGFATGGVVGGFQAAFQDAVSLIGRGRREADEITAVQTPVSQLLTSVNQEMGNPATTVQRLLDLQRLVMNAGSQFRDVLNRPWKDGRAARQAFATIFGNENGTTDADHPGYLTVTLRNIQGEIAKRGGVPSTTPAAQESSAGPLIGIAALVALFLK